MARVIAGPAVDVRAVPRRRVRAVLAWLHLWVGLTVGLVFAVIGLSGSALVFHDELLRLQHPVLSGGAPRVDPAVLGSIVERESARGLTAVQFPSEAMPNWMGFYADGRRAHFSMDDGRVLLERSTGTDPLLWLHELHTHLLAGEAGEEVAGAVGLVSLALVFVGLYLWWPKRGRMLAQLRVYRGPPVRRWLTWHRSSGVVLLPLVVLSTLTGVGMVYHAAARDLLTGLFGGSDLPATPVASAAPVDWARVLAAAQGAIEDAEVKRLAVPAKDAGIVQFRLRQPAEWHPTGRTTAAIEANGAAVLQTYAAAEQPLGSRASDSIYPLHIGIVGGLPMRWLTFVTGLLPAFLLVTGFLFWRRRRTARSARPGR